MSDMVLLMKLSKKQLQSKCECQLERRFCRYRNWLIEKNIFFLLEVKPEFINTLEKIDIGDLSATLTGNTQTLPGFVRRR